MPKRNNDSSDDSPRKKNSDGNTTSLDFKFGELVTDITGKKWKLGSSIGIGGFGEIYDAYDNVRSDVKTGTQYVAKFEKHSNGPLFVEINCYLRIAKLEMIEDWKKENRLKYLGMPHYVASGSHTNKDGKYRFLILPKYKRDLGEILRENKSFNIKTVLTISIQILDILEYIHSKGYVHSDIKASNIMLGKSDVVEEAEFEPKKEFLTRPRRTVILPQTRTRTRTSRKKNLRPIGNVNYIDDIPYLDEVLNLHEKKLHTKELEHIYLLDFGLASKYLLTNGEHREFCTDERRAHAGTTLFCSRDAHKGVASRRSDMESLAYNMVYWLTGSLPWIDDLDEPEEVEKKKIRSFKHLQSFLAYCFNNNCPQFIMDYFTYLNNLQFEQNPNYEYCKQIFDKAFHTYDLKQDSILDFDAREASTNKKIKRNKILVGHNMKLVGTSFLKTSPLMPLHSNILFKRPKLRKAAKNKKSVESMMHWSKILIDPEEIIKQGRERKVTDASDPGSPNLSLSELESLNPTYAMIEVYNKCKEREASSPSYKADSVSLDNIEGYTPAMMSVYLKMKEREELEYQMHICNNNNNYINAKESQTVTKKQKYKKKTIKRSESPILVNKKLQKSQATVPTKKVVSSTKKIKGAVPTRRPPYRLRG